MPGSISSDESGFIFAILHSIFPFVTHHITRKLGHFTEYAILGLIIDKEKKYHPLVLCGMVAFFDETIQLFVANRAGMIQDVWIDLAGALLGIVVASIVGHLLVKKSEDKELHF